MIKQALFNAKQALKQQNLDSVFDLIYQENNLTLIKLDEPKIKVVFIDFMSAKLLHRQRFGGGKKEAIAKAVGIKGNYAPTVYDATAGLGVDAFVLASLGCKVTLFERSKVVRALLIDALQRANLNPQSAVFISNHLILSEIESITNLSLPLTQNAPDVIYVDPMFPHRTKSALVKKEMRMLQQLVGTDDDATHVFETAMKIAKKRVIVKRPNYADHINNQKPTLEIKTKNHRFDVFICN